jgi:hypothetical protein
MNLIYTSSTSLSLQVKAASSTVPFEYTVVKPGYELKYQTASWTAISSSQEVTVTKTAAPVGSHIYIRKKSVAASEETEFSLASADIDITGSAGVAYPSAPKLDSVTNLVSIAGVCKPEYSSSYLTFTMYSPTKTTVSAMDFYDTYGNKKGSVTTKSSVALNPSYSGYQDKYIITTKITSTSNIDTATKEVLYANIFLASSEKITSTETTGIHLYLYPSTELNNSNNSTYTNDFKRIYLSNADSDASSFQFQLDFGTANVIDPSGINKYTSEATAVKSIQYNGYTLVKDTDYSVTYGSYMNEDSQSVTTATVTVNAATMEKSLSSLKLDQKIPLVIELNNNEILNQDVYITLVTTAKAKNTPIAWSITEGSLQETKTSTVTDSNGNKSTVTEEVITYTLELEVYDSTYAVSISDVTWGGTSILGSASVSSGKITISLKNAKINKLTTNSTDTKNIVITLSNGFVINSGIKLTIIKAY